MRFYPCLVLSLGLALTASVARGHDVADDMRAAARAWLDSLTPEQQRAVTFAVGDPERENWNFVPTPRRGLSFQEMTPMQHALALALLRSGLSHTGMARAEAIISLELVLKELEGGAAHRDPTRYFVTIFGPPAADQTWGWRFEGHHLSFNFTLVGGREVFFAPSFMGSNPAEVRRGPRRGERVLGDEEDLGLALVNALDQAQRRIAIFSDQALPEIVTSNRKRVEPLQPDGIDAAQLRPDQRAQLMALVKLYLDRWRPELAAETWAEIEAAGVDAIRFAWAGGLDRGHQTYYRIQGPTFLIEFDNFQGNGNHIHTTFREFKGDFGHDLLAEHYAHDHLPARE
jgi:hypothetical protein